LTSDNFRNWFIQWRKTTSADIYAFIYHVSYSRKTKTTNLLDVQTVNQTIQLTIIVSFITGRQACFTWSQQVTNDFNCAPYVLILASVTRFWNMQQEDVRTQLAFFGEKISNERRSLWWKCGHPRWIHDMCDVSALW